MQASISLSRSWADKVINVLKPVPHPFASKTALVKNRAQKHLSGHTWRHIFTTSVYHDLSNPTSGTVDPNECSLRWRMVRLDSTGLSGVLVYAIPFPTGASDSTTSSELTLRTVFGDLDDPSVPGMSVDELYDAVEGRLSFFPTYACTSFICGQVMHASLSGSTLSCPVPALNGFSVLHETAISERQDSFALDRLALPFGEYLGSTEDFPCDLDTIEDRALRSLCVRSSKLAPKPTSHLELDESSGEDDDSDHELSIISLDSVGPETPILPFADMPFTGKPYSLPIFRVDVETSD